MQYIIWNTIDVGCMYCKTVIDHLELIRFGRNVSIINVRISNERPIVTVLTFCRDLQICLHVTVIVENRVHIHVASIMFSVSVDTYDD